MVWGGLSGSEEAQSQCLRARCVPWLAGGAAACTAALAGRYCLRALPAAMAPTVYSLHTPNGYFCARRVPMNI